MVLSPASASVVLTTPAPVSHRTAEENIGLGYLARILRDSGARVTVIDGWLEGLTAAELTHRILSQPRPTWVGFACYRSNVGRAIETLESVRCAWPGIRFVVGGYGPSFDAGYFLDQGFDVAVRGEAETIVVPLTMHFLCGRPALSEIPGITHRDGDRVIANRTAPLILDLDSIPFPDRDTLSLSLRRRSAIHVLSSRGCAAHCLFCSIVAFQRLHHGPQWRQRSIVNFVDEIEDLTRRGVRHFKVVDDSLLEPPRDLGWCRALADEIQGRGLRVHLRSSIRADRVDDAIVVELARAGFFSFSCGIENYAASALRRMNKTATVEQNRTALEVFERHGILVQAGHILFDHGVTMDELWENLRGMREHEWTISKGAFTEMYAADGTPVSKLLDNRGLLTRDTSAVGNHSYPVLDPRARKVYEGMKRWHRAHTRLYDKAIDPLSAPKALDPDELALFHPLCVELRRVDLEIMEGILRLADGDRPLEEVLEFVEDQRLSREAWYARMETAIDGAYRTTGLLYDGVENPFVCG